MIAPEKPWSRAYRRRFLNGLALKKIRTCMSLHYCLLCDKDITMGQQYRDGGYPRRAHETCFQAACKEDS